MSKREVVYFSIDIETDGQAPGLNSMRQLGCAAFTPDSAEPIATFQVNISPLEGAVPDAATMDWWKQFPEVWEAMQRDTVTPSEAIKSFALWVTEVAAGRKAVACAWPASWDWAFVYYYFCAAGIQSPFGHSALDIKTLWVAYTLKKWGRGWASGRTYKRDVPQEWKGDAKHTHVGVEDAIEQGKILVNLLQELQKEGT